MSDNTFSKLSDDVVLKILYLLEDDPRYWARLCCVSNKLSSLISTVCYKSRCISTLSSDLISLSSTSSSSSRGDSEWPSLYKIAVCCPGLLHSGVLLDNSDFGLLRELGPDENYQNTLTTTTTTTNNNNNNNSCSQCDPDPDPVPQEQEQDQARDTWTLYDDLYFDTVYDNSEEASASSEPPTTPTELISIGVVSDSNTDEYYDSVTKKRKVSSPTTPSRLLRPHLASGVWNLSREQGNKVLASRFREDSLYISDWPGCIHLEEKRNYMVFRGVFKNFKRSRVWRTINDGNRSKVNLNCAFCDCKDIWDLHSSFCLKRGFGFHDDGEPVVRAYVCGNGHVSGAWTDFPLYF